ncbi:hypothetical protein [Saccharopolyspora terrae]|uniref:hypothetical protein n=1 Tax=Saccharopolyspora terrae TaxID=2530384 RepID=UPI001F1DB70A|nr:hypothetical protein [Saccharopolyspora terrae]
MGAPTPFATGSRTRQELAIDTLCPTGETLANRVEWLPGDRIRAVCRCGAEREFDAAAPMWDWLVHHPDLHDQGRMEST